MNQLKLKKLTAVLMLSSLILSAEAKNTIFQTTNTVVPKNAKSAKFSFFKVGGRKQRVRFYPANAQFIDDNNAAYNDIIAYDPVRGNSRNACGTSFIGIVAESATRANVSSFAKGQLPSKFNHSYRGLIVNPSMVICGAKLLEQIKSVSYDMKDIYKQWQIDEINIFLYITSKNAKDRHYKLEIAPVVQIPNDPALNVQIPITPSGECLLPSNEELRAAIISAAKK